MNFEIPLVWICRLEKVFEIGALICSPLFCFFYLCRAGEVHLPLETPIHPFIEKDLVNYKPRLNEQLVVLSEDDRPDHLQKRYRLQFPQGQQALVNEKEPLFVSMNGLGEMEPVEEARAFLSISLFDHQMQVIEGPDSLRGCQWPLKKQKKSSSEVNKPWIDWLRSCLFLDVDLLLEKHPHLLIDKEGKYRLFDVEHKSLYFLKEGGCYILSEFGLEDLGKEGPFLKIEVLNSKRLVARIWDRTGFYSDQIELEPQGKKELAVGSLFNHPRPSGFETFFCKIGAQSLFLKAGDWWIQEGEEWRKMDSTERLELPKSCLSPLLIIHSVDKKRAKVELFDYLRTCSKEWWVPLETRKPSGGGFFSPLMDSDRGMNGDALLPLIEEEMREER